MKSPRQYVRGKLLSYIERNVANPNSWLLHAIHATSTTASGANVTPDTAMKVAAVYAAVKVLSETIAGLPLRLFKRDGDNKIPATDHPTFHLFDEPNSHMTSFELRENLVSNTNYHGNAYHQKVYRAGQVRELIPLMSENMAVSRDNGKVKYLYTEQGEETPFRESKIWHVKNMSKSSVYNDNAQEGILGISPIVAGKEVIGAALAADEYAARYFSNNASAGLHASHPGHLSENAKEFLRQSLEEYGKLENKFKSIVTSEDVKLTPLGGTNEQSQFLETRQYSVEEISRLFRLPAVLIGHPDKTMTYASAEQMFRSFVMHTIVPWLVRLEQSMNRYLLPDEDRDGYFWEHNVSGLLRGDTKARYEAYTAGRNGGWLNVDEIRALENMNALPDGSGQTYLEPLNMQDAGKTGADNGTKPNDQV